MTYELRSLTPDELRELMRRPSHVEVQNACEFVEDSARDALQIVKELSGPYTRSQLADWQHRLNNAASALSDASLELSLLR